jgi:hypothetical protein
VKPWRQLYLGRVLAVNRGQSPRAAEAGVLSARCRGVWTAAVRGRTAAVQAGNYYYLFFFLLFFLLFLAMPLTPLPDPVGQRNVDQASTYH